MATLTVDVSLDQFSDAEIGREFDQRGLERPEDAAAEKVRARMAKEDAAETVVRLLRIKDEARRFGDWDNAMFLLEQELEHWQREL